MKYNFDLSNISHYGNIKDKRQNFTQNSVAMAQQVYHIKSIADVIPPESIGVKVEPKDALLRYIKYLQSECLEDHGAQWIAKTLLELQVKITKDTAVFSSDKIASYRKEIDLHRDRLQGQVGNRRRSHVVDSEIVQKYVPLKACVIQSLANFGLLGQTAALFHAHLWTTNDPLKYYDRDENINPLYARYNLQEQIPSSVNSGYDGLVKVLNPGKYIFNVTSPNGPNGHMFFVEITAGGKNPNVAKHVQDKDNTQTWTSGDKILRYWSL